MTFKSKENLFEKYGINPDEVKVVSKTVPDLDAATKKMLIQKHLEALELAEKNSQLGNFSNRFFASSVMFENGKWSTASNIENSDEDAFCGERSAVVKGWNESLDDASLDKLKSDPGYKDQVNSGLKVKYLVYGDPCLSVLDSCADCLSWMNLKYFGPKTVIAGMSQEAGSGKKILIAEKLTDVLPYYHEIGPSKTTKPVSTIKIEDSDITDRAKDALAKNNITKEALVEVVNKAKESYELNKTSELSDKNVGVAELLNPGNVIVPGERMDWTRRWFVKPDELAGANGYQFIKKCQNILHSGAARLEEMLPPIIKFNNYSVNIKDFIAKLKASPDEDPKIATVAYYGDDKLPYLASLGRISQGRGSADTLVLVIRDDKIKVSTIRDTMPYLYISSKKKKPAAVKS